LYIRISAVILVDMFDPYLQDEESLLNETISEIKKVYDIEPVDLPRFTPARFELLKYYTNILNRKTVRIAGSNTYISFVEVEFPVDSNKYGTILRKDFQFYMFTFLSGSFGHILIRKETFEDKICELFSHIELDFKEDKPFSKRFYVLANEKEKAIRLLNKKFREAILKVGEEDVLIEVAEDKVLITNKKTVEVRSAVKLLALGYELENSA
jgi:hypothetical protein